MGGGIFNNHFTTESSSEKHTEVLSTHIGKKIIFFFLQEVFYSRDTHTHNRLMAFGPGLPG